MGTCGSPVGTERSEASATVPTLADRFALTLPS
jgi:hypothetical protein